MPLIAMTREMGSLGKDVATIVAKHMGKPVVYHELIEPLANKLRLRKSHVIRFLDGKANVWESLTTDKTSMAIYTADEILALAESNSVAVIRGWGAAHLLRPIKHVICVRVCAPVPVRVQRMMERLGTDDQEFVTNEIKLSTEALTAITRRHFDVSWQHSDQYDLVVNTERVSVEECAEELIALAENPQFQETEQSMQQLRNIALESHVRAALRVDPRTTKMQFSVSADRGTVSIHCADERYLLFHASEIAAKVTGVKDIKT
jgi:cytidylate kinase